MESMKFYSEKFEYKARFADDLNKDVIAFANGNGGTIFLGFLDNRTVVGLMNPDEVMLQVANCLKDTIAPDIMPFVAIKTEEIEGVYVVKVEVSVGTQRPYYIKEKGLNSSGVYIRKGCSSQPMSGDSIQEMIRDVGGKSYENFRSLNQQLTFDYLKKEFELRNIPLDPSSMQMLKFFGDDGLYTNLAFLLSDQCTVTTKVAVFQDDDKSVFRDCREFSGSLLEQLNDVYKELEFYNRTQARVDGLIGIDTKDYPQEALRETLVNSIIHRDYALSGSNQINIYGDHIEIVSLGGLVPGIELKSIFLGVSQTRNPNLASVLYRLKLIESYGTGIRNIERAYKNSTRKPKFETAKGVFRVTLPNINTGYGN